MGAASATGRATGAGTRVGNGSGGRSVAAAAVGRAVHLGAEHVAHRAAVSHREGPFSRPDHRQRPVVAAQRAREPPCSTAFTQQAAEQRSTRPGGAARKAVGPTVSWPDGRAEGARSPPGSPSVRSLRVLPLARCRSGAAVSLEPMQDGADGDGAAPADASRACGRRSASWARSTT